MTSIGNRRGASMTHRLSNDGYAHGRFGHLAAGPFWGSKPLNRIPPGVWRAKVQVERTKVDE